MAIAPLTGFKAFTFDGEKSTDYGVAILGEGVFNAPERDVEMITIPGRSGQFVLDNGRFENIEVTYPANLIADSEADFAEALSDFRNMLCSRRGYVRLQDDYHPDEYRMAVYKEGLDVDEKVLKAGEFTITFDCKPQRWLTSGETAVTVTSGDTLTNPTLFESSPLLEATGSGSIEFNGYEIDFAGIPYGETVLYERTASYNHLLSDTVTVTLDTSLLNVGDAIYPEVKEYHVQPSLSSSSSTNFSRMSVVSTTNALDATIFSPRAGDLRFRLYPDLGTGFVYGTSKTITSSAEYQYRVSGTDYTETVQVITTYGGADTYTVRITSTGTLPTGVTRGKWNLVAPTMYGDSTQPIQGVPIYIDCDLGEAYLINGTEYVSLNHRIDLGSELPKLASGSNTVTFDNTITELKVQPRWWKV